MSLTRDILNVEALKRMVGDRVSPDVAQAIAVCAQAAGSGPALATRWQSIFEVTGTTLTVGRAYRWSGGSWVAVTSSLGTRAAVAVCIASSGSPAASTMLQAGEMDRSGTAGASIYLNATGDLTHTYPGDEDNETTTAPWVWPVGWQFSSSLAIILPCDPYRPRRIKYCLIDGATQIEVVMREYPPDPA
jgi:hypothetical protein